jgi:hypothetical protein
MILNFIVTAYHLVFLTMYINCITLYGEETWTLRAVDQKTWNVLKCGAGEGWTRSVGPIM